MGIVERDGGYKAAPFNTNFISHNNYNYAGAALPPWAR